MPESACVLSLGVFCSSLETAVQRRLYGTGNAPTLLKYSDLKKVAQTWMDTSHAIFDDEEAHKVMWPPACTNAKLGSSTQSSRRHEEKWHSLAF